MVQRKGLRLVGPGLLDAQRGEDGLDGGARDADHVAASVQDGLEN